jgi:hypothetical protein
MMFFKLTPTTQNTITNQQIKNYIPKEKSNKSTDKNGRTVWRGGEKKNHYTNKRMGGAGAARRTALRRGPLPSMCPRGNEHECCLGAYIP